jgi:hypothetical protein
MLGSVNQEAWQRAWEKIMQRHAILRTTYNNHNGKSAQQVHHSLEIPLEVTEAYGWTEAELKSKILREADHPFNLETESVVRVNLFKITPHESLQLITIN